MTVGKTGTRFVSEGIEEYRKRINRYVSFSIEELPDIRNSRSMTESLQKQKEGEAILARIQQSDCLVLLDERGREYSSIEFAAFCEKLFASGRKRVVFLVGGPYGFSDDVYARADSKISLSRMTFNHEMVRMFFAEQIYRAMTILRNEPYHHE